jgi:lysozyme
MLMTPEGRDMLMDLEGVRGEVYKDVAGLPTIGVGHLLTKNELTSGKILIGTADNVVHYRNGLTHEEIETLLGQDLSGVEFHVNEAVVSALTEQQFDALVSFAFNVGSYAFRASTLLRVINKVQFDKVPEQMRRWIYSGGKTWDGLVARREVEIERWLA